MRKHFLLVTAGAFAVNLLFAQLGVTTAYAAASPAIASVAWNLDEKIHPDLAEEFRNSPAVIKEVRDVQMLRSKLAPDLNHLPEDESVTVRNTYIAGAPGTQDIRIRIYEPKERQGALPALLWIHGGGYLIGSPESDEGTLLQMAKELKSVVVAPDYRLAPEHRFPAAIDDCYRTLEWMANEENGLKIRKDRIAVAGASAGGGLTAAVALRARDENGPAICFQMPLYPMLDNHNDTVSSYQITDERVWNRKAGEAAWDIYLNGKSKGDISPYAAPARAKELAGLPPAYMMIGSLDLFRDETIAYAQRLLQVGVPVELHVYPGIFHAFESVMPTAKISREARQAYIEALNRALNE